MWTLTKIAKRTLVITIWHKQELGGILGPCEARSIIRIVNYLWKLAYHKF